MSNMGRQNTYFNAEEIKCSPHCQDCSLATASGMFRREQCLMCSKMADTYAHFLQYNFFKTQITVKLVSGWIGPCSEVSRCQSFCLFLNLRFFTILCPPIASVLLWWRDRKILHKCQRLVNILKDRIEISYFMIEFYQGCLLNELQEMCFSEQLKATVVSLKYIYSIL